MLRNLFAFSFLLMISAVAFAQDAPVQPGERRLERIVVAPFGGSYLGIQPQEVTRENYAKFGLNEVRGVAVGKVVEDSAAGRAGLQVNDVIVEFNGTQITSSRQLLRLIAEVAPDHKANLTILRNGNRQEISVTMGKRDTTFAGAPLGAGGEFSFENLPAIPNAPDFSRLPNVEGFRVPRPDAGNVLFLTSRRQIGVGVTPLTKQLGEYFGVSEGRGLLINSVGENSPAASAGLKAGDVITMVDGKEVNSVADLIKALGEKKEGAVTITFFRNKTMQTVMVEPKTSENRMTIPADAERLLRVYEESSK